MVDTDVFGFLGLREDWDVLPDVAIMQIPLEMTVSYGTGTSKGPSFSAPSMDLGPIPAFFLNLRKTSLLGTSSLILNNYYSPLF